MVVKQLKCPKCGKVLKKSGKCVPCRNKEILEACINHSKNIKNHTTSLEFENSKYMKDVWKESGLARIVNQILLVLNKEIKKGVYEKEVVEKKHYFVLVGTPKDEEETEEEDGLVELDDEEDEEEEFEEDEEDEITDEDEEITEEDEDKEEPNKIDEILDDDESAMKQYEEETGNKAITTKGTLRKDYIKWKKTNWD